MTATFSLRALIRRVLLASDAADPDTLAQLVFDAIEDTDRVEALRQALHVAVREIVRQERMQHPITGALAVAATTTKTTAAKSWKVAAIREGWQRTLRNRIHAGHGEWKMLADCTRDDLLHAAAERRAMAERNAVTAGCYTALAELLEAHEVKTVADLPEDVLARALGSVAA